jgi:hypothetical protein
MLAVEVMPPQKVCDGTIPFVEDNETANLARLGRYLNWLMAIDIVDLAKEGLNEVVD